MNKKSIYIAFLLLLLIIPSVMAINNVQQSLGIFKVNTTVILKQTCADCTYNNVTSVLYPNSNQAMGSVQMTKSGSEYNATFTNSNSIGTYIVNGIGNPDGIDTVWTYSFDVTVTGNEFTIPMAIIYIVFFILLLALFGLTLYGAIVIRWGQNRNDDGHVISINNLKYVKIFMWAMSYTLLVILSFLAWNISYGFSSVQLITNIFEFVSWTLLSGLFPIVVISIIVAVVNFVTDKKLRKSILRGVPLR